jgi:hypothetical protein
MASGPAPRREITDACALSALKSTVEAARLFNDWKCRTNPSSSPESSLLLQSTDATTASASL